MQEMKDVPCYAGKLKGSNGGIGILSEIATTATVIRTELAKGLGKLPTRYRKQQLQLVQSACNKCNIPNERRRRDIFEAKQVQR